MPTIPGFIVLKEIYKDNHALLYKAVREQDKTPVIIKISKDKYPSAEKLARFRREYDLIHSVAGDGTIADYDLEKYDNSLAIILHDFGTKTLKDKINHETIHLKEFLLLAIEITGALEKIHSHHIIHKNINPANILIDEESQKIKIIDFSIACTIRREEPTIQNLQTLEGMLPYISPEQTGRMNRGIDYRSDYYSLGMIFYQMLTGILPFSSDDMMEIVHNHIAKIPIAPNKINPTIPEVVSNIVLKLMAKTAEDRYQSTFGIKSDLKKCLDQLQEKGKIEFFEIAKKDISSNFCVSEKLYGREEERKKLLDAFDRASNDGNAEVVMVTGFAGIGKSRLIHEIQKPIVQKHGYFISGKFDQYKRDIPYTAIIQVLQELVSQILTENEEQIKAWKTQITLALGDNGKVISDVIPDIIKIIGPQPPIPELNPKQTKNRFNLMFQNFIQALATAKHPLAIFLDDLQWADNPSLKLLEILLTNLDTKNFLLIGAYRDNEVDATHPLTTTFSTLIKAGTLLNNIKIKPLELTHIEELLIDTLHSHSDQVTSLAKVCIEKTQGNPFFLGQFLQVLFKEHLIEFDNQNGRWKWDVGYIQKKGFTDNVVELMINKIMDLPEKSRYMLQLSACLGGHFDLKTLSIISMKSMPQVSEELWPALQEGLIIPVDDAYQVITDSQQRKISYQFLHDRVQQAAYSLINEDDKKNLHLTIGRLLLKNATPEQINESPMNIVNHLNIGITLVTDTLEKVNIAKLNLSAGIKSKSAIAYTSAINYLKTGISLLPSNSWSQLYDLTIQLYLEAAQTAYLISEFYEMENYSQIVLEKAKNQLDKLKIYETKITYLLSQNNLTECIKFIISVLNEFGIKIPENPSTIDVLMLVAQIKWTLLGKKNNDILNLPVMTEAHWLGINRILHAAGPVAYLVNQSLLLMFSMTGIKIGLKHGINPQLAASFSGYAALLASILNNPIDGYKYGRLGLDIIEKLGDNKYKPQVYIAYYAIIAHFHDHIHEIIPELLNAFHQSLNVGDFEYAGLSLCIYNSLLLVSGKELTTGAKEAENHTRFLLKINQKTSYQYALLYWRGILKLLNYSEEDMKKIGAHVDEKKLLNEFIKNNDKEGLYNHYLINLFCSYFISDPSGSYKWATLATQFKYKIIDSISHLFFSSFCCLSFLKNYSNLDKKEKKEKLKYINKILKKFKKLSAFVPMNYLGKYYLIEAERCRVLGMNDNASICYDKAIELAKKYDYTDEEAIANELAAKFFISLGKNNIARGYMNDAYYTYLRWGAICKVRQLEHDYPEMILLKEQNQFSTTRKTAATQTKNHSSSVTTTELLDLSTIIKASETISKEIVLANLLAQLMQIAIENAGAQHGFLLLEKNNTWYIEAEGSVNTETTVLQSKSIENVLPKLVINYVINTKKSIILNNAISDNQFSKDIYIKTNKPKSILCMPLLNQGVISAILYLENNLASNVFTSSRLDLLNLLSGQIVISIANARLYTDTIQLNTKLSEANKSLLDTNKSYARFVPQEFLNLLGKNSILDVEVGDQVQKEMTVLFLDIRNFTTLSEKMTPKENFAFINHFLNYIEPNIVTHHGFVDKYLGDGIMALFPTNADDALQAAIAMLRTVEGFNAVQIKHDKSPIKIGIGLNSGILMLGTVGEENRIDGTVISDAVNVASRIEEFTKKYSTSLLISEDTYSKLQDSSKYYIRKIDTVLVRGKTKHTTVYEVFDADPLQTRELKKQTTQDFEKAVALYNMKKYSDAAKIFKKIITINKEDQTAKFYYQLASKRKAA